MIKLIYTKTGNVVVDAKDGDQPWTFVDPTGFPTKFLINMLADTVDLFAKIQDTNNGPINKQYTVTLDLAAKQAVVAFFNDHIARLLREKFPEFVDLEVEVIFE